MSDNKMALGEHFFLTLFSALSSRNRCGEKEKQVESNLSPKLGDIRGGGGQVESSPDPEETVSLWRHRQKMNEEKVA